MKKVIKLSDKEGRLFTVTDVRDFLNNEHEDMESAILLYRTKDGLFWVKSKMTGASFVHDMEQAKMVYFLDND